MMTFAYGFLIPAPSAAACKILPEDLINLTSEPVKWPQSAKKTRQFITFPFKYLSQFDGTACRSFPLTSVDGI